MAESALLKRLTKQHVAFTQQLIHLQEQQQQQQQNQPQQQQQQIQQADRAPPTALYQYHAPRYVFACVPWEIKHSMFGSQLVDDTQSK